jgi:hypothetical protein
MACDILAKHGMFESYSYREEEKSLNNCVACSEGFDEPIVTIDFLVSKIYLVNKSSAVAQVQRNSKVITFDPFLDSAAERMVNCSKEGLKLLTSKENGGGDLNRKV